MFVFVPADPADPPAAPPAAPSTLRTVVVASGPPLALDILKRHVKKAASQLGWKPHETGVLWRKILEMYLEQISIFRL